MSVMVVNGGSGYTSAPTVTFTGGGATTPATATAVVVGGAVTDIVVSNPGVGYTSAPVVEISGGGGAGAAAVASVDTEVKMVPAPDGRAGGIPDDTTAGPPFILIGTEGGFMPAPYVTNDPAIKPLYVTFDTDPRSITVTNIKNTNLLMGPAQRTDIIVDFSTLPVGTTLILYNDSPAPAPASDLRYDYYTGDPDNSATGGAPPTLPGYGPNTRTIMQFKVVPLTGPADPDNFATTLAKLQNPATGLPNVFATTEPAHIIPDGVYINNFDTAIKDATNNQLPVHFKTIQELFELDYGRMNALLGTELQFTNFNTQTTHQMGYTDLPTEVIPEGQPQVWMIIHNGVDTHFVHFHLMNVQVVNRVDWAGVVKPPYPDEIGWRETIRADPLEQVIVAVKPAVPTLPAAWPPLPESIRPMNVAMPPTGEVGKTYNGPPNTTVGGTNTNPLFDFGWEYVWHCHLLGHEENDMMRALAIDVPLLPPAADPANVTVTLGGPSNSQVTIQWDAPPVSDDIIGYKVYRNGSVNPIAVVTPFRPLADVYNPALDPLVDPTVGPALQAFLHPSYVDLLVSPNTLYSYQVIAFNARGDSPGTTLPTPAPGNTGSWAPATFVSITPSVATPHAQGTAVTFTAQAYVDPLPLPPVPSVLCTIGCEYRFWLDGGLTPVQDWSLLNTWTMPASTATGAHVIQVDVRTDPALIAPDATVSLNYYIRLAPASSVVITTDQSSPHIAGSAVVVTASGQGSSGYDYKFSMGPDLAHLSIVQNYGGGRTWTMPAATAVGNYVIYVQVRTDASVAQDVAGSINYSVQPGVTFQAGANGTLTGTLAQALALGVAGTPITAVPNQGYHLVNWTGTNGFVTSTVNPLTVTGDGNGHIVTANFAINAYTVDFVAGANGTLSGTASQNVNYGASASAVEAVPASFYHFVDWTGTGGFRSVSNPLTVSNVTADMNLTANFDVGATMVPDGDMGYGGTLDDVNTAMLIALGSIPATPGDLAHGDVAPLVNGRPQPDGKIDIGDVEVILRKVMGLVSW